MTLHRLPRGWRIRLFLTCWVIYVVHFATDVVREHYLVMSMVENQTFALDPYYGLHVDIFQNPPEATVQGAHHGANPGISMMAALPYVALRPLVDVVVARELASRPPVDTVIYRDNRPRRVEFYGKIRERGLDIRFGLVSAITQVFTMAPLTAAMVVAMAELLVVLGLAAPMVLAGGIVFAFGTPVFFRAAYLNQNLAIAALAFAAFLLLWNPGRRVRWGPTGRVVLAGFLGGLCLLNDYSGGLALAVLGVYACWTRFGTGSFPAAVRAGAWYTVGAIGPILALGYYQWASFGHPFYPPQHWMAPVEWIDVGYQGVGGFVPELFGMLLFDPRFGLFIVAPALALALAAPFLRRFALPRAEVTLCLSMALVFVLFFATVQYTRLQWVTGFRYLAPVVPFLFLPAFLVAVRLPRVVALALGLGSLGLTWALAMVRDQGTVFRNLMRLFVEGFQLPWLTTLGKLAAQYSPWLEGRPSPLPVFALTAIVLAAIWMIRSPWAPLTSDPAGTEIATPPHQE